MLLRESLNLYDPKAPSSTKRGLKTTLMDFPGGPVVKNLPADAGARGSLSGLETAHVLWEN